MNTATPAHYYQVRTKIVATVGPACQQPEMLRQLACSGVDVFRVNTAHGGRSFHDAVVDAIRDVSEDVGRPLAILVDLCGPKIRLGELSGGALQCLPGDTLTFVRGPAAAANHLTCNYEPLIDEVQAGHLIMLADGAVALEARKKTRDSVECRVVSGGVIRSRQGINVPGATLSVEALTDDDRQNAIWAAQRDIDYVGMSFVRRPEDIQRLKDLLAAHGGTAHVVAKIEKREALDRLHDIIAAADAVMVARGDLGVEIDIAQTPLVQKQIIAACREQLKPVIVATQMLDSMQHSNRPTRAEVTDIANAILDGADACMLSGETAIGEYPLESVEMMNRVMQATERLLGDAPAAPPAPSKAGVTPVTAAVTYGAGRIADQLSAALVVVATRSGNTARVKSKQRDFVRTVGVSDSAAVLRRMCLYWGIIPLPGAPVADGPALRAFIDQWGLQEGMLRAGDLIVFVTGTEFVPLAHNLVVVHEVAT
jgi:pyruvate kinase